MLFQLALAFIRDTWPWLLVVAVAVTLTLYFFHA